MAYNSPKFDKDAHYAAKTTKQLEQLVVFWNDVLSQYPDRKIANEELNLVKMKLAERIGKK